MINSVFLTVALSCALAGEASGAATDDFSARVRRYLELRDRVERGLPDLGETRDPAKIAERQKILGDAIQQARRDARPGDIFYPEARAWFRRVVREALKGPAGQPAKAMTKIGNPAEEGHRVPVRVNATYPSSAPLASVPPTLLLRLPELPDALQYRFIGRDLILLDSKANLIVDYVPNAVPE